MPEPNTVCDMCGELVYRRPTQLKLNKNNYCSALCQHESMRKKGPKMGSRNKRIPRRIRKERGDICQVCGWDEARCDVHHIVEWSEGGTDEPDNLIVLCPNHHRLVHEGDLSVDELRSYM